MSYRTVETCDTNNMILTSKVSFTIQSVHPPGGKGSHYFRSVSDSPPRVCSGSRVLGVGMTPCERCDPSVGSGAFCTFFSWILARH
jgi:hypothetical protein